MPSASGADLYRYSLRLDSWKGSGSHLPNNIMILILYTRVIEWLRQVVSTGSHKSRLQKVRDAGGKLLGVPDTTRNWNTIKAVIDVLRRE